MLRVILGFVLTLSLSVAMAPVSRAQTETVPLVGITSISINAEIQAIIDGLRDRLSERGFQSGKTVNVAIRDGNTDGDQAANVINEFAQLKARIIVAISLPSIQAALKSKTRIPIVGANLTVEQATQISSEHRRRAVTGIAQTDSRDDQFALIRILAPGVKQVAVPVNPQNGAIKRQIRDLNAAARNHDLTVTALPVSVDLNAVGNDLRTFDPATTALLLDRALLPDVPVEALAIAAATQKLAFFATDEDSVIRGALAAMVVEPFGIGQQLGDLVADILEKPASARRPFERARASHLIFNEDGRAVLDVEGIETALAQQRGSVIDWADDAGPRPRLKPTPPTAPPPLGIVRGITIPTPRAKPARP
jgi:putative ABC transport system substrate-binding protein